MQAHLLQAVEGAREYQEFLAMMPERLTLIFLSKELEEKPEPRMIMLV
jgi:hypothetical protein